MITALRFLCAAGCVITSMVSYYAYAAGATALAIVGFGVATLALTMALWPEDTQ